LRRVSLKVFPLNCIFLFSCMKTIPPLTKTFLSLLEIFCNNSVYLSLLRGCGSSRVRPAYVHGHIFLQGTKYTVKRKAKTEIIFYQSVPFICGSGPGSSVGIATGYELDGPGIESRWGRDFPPVQTDTGTHSASCKMPTGSFPGVKSGRYVTLTPHPF